MSVSFSKTTLANGLDVIVHESHHAPLAAVSVWYHTGSKHERPGMTGLAHLFEHLMFEGGAHQPRGYFEPLQEAGGSLNGSTSADRTNYWELVPRGALDLALWMEADRMGWLLPVLTQERFETQRGVVLNERRQNYENTPYGLASIVLHAAMYPPDHPYHWPTIGSAADLQAATLDDARAFFGRYYQPSNASLVVAGDVDTSDVVRSVEHLFGAIPGGSPVPQPTAPPVEVQPRRLILADRVDAPRLYLAWPSPALFAPGDAELDMFADLLGNGRTSRLYARLIHERRVASELAAHQSSRELGSTFAVYATAAPGHTLAELDDAIRSEIEALTAGPTDRELERCRAEFEAAFVFRIQSLGGFGGRADQLNAYNTYFGEPDSFDRDLQRYVRASPADVARAARAWVDPDRAVRLSIVPHGQLDRALPDSEPVHP